MIGLIFQSIALGTVFKILGHSFHIEDLIMMTALH